MASKQKNFRLSEETIKDFEKIVDFCNEHMQEFSIKKATPSDVLSILIQKEIKNLRDNDYRL